MHKLSIINLIKTSHPLHLWSAATLISHPRFPKIKLALKPINFVWACVYVLWVGSGDMCVSLYYIKYAEKMLQWLWAPWRRVLWWSEKICLFLFFLFFTPLLKVANCIHFLSSFFLFLRTTAMHQYEPPVQGFNPMSSLLSFYSMYQCNHGSRAGKLYVQCLQLRVNSTYYLTRIRVKQAPN